MSDFEIIEFALQGHADKRSCPNRCSRCSALAALERIEAERDELRAYERAWERVRYQPYPDALNAKLALDDGGWIPRKHVAENMDSILAEEQEVKE